MAQVTAFDIKNGKTNWQVSIEEFTDDPLPGIAGGLAVRGETLFVHAGGRSLAALVGTGRVNNMVNITAFSGSRRANNNRTRSHCRNRS
jgi:outer membrane protein assembly factor BamB